MKMKKVIIRKFNLKTLFNGIVAISIPLFLVVGILGIIGGITAGQGWNVVTYYLISILIGPVIYGIIGMVLGLAYNKISPKLGQFEIEVEDKE